MKGLFARSLALGAGIATVGALVATSAVAHPKPFNVTAGSAAAATKVNVTGTSGTINFKDTTTGITLTCTSSVLTGFVKVAPKAKGPKLATVNGNTAKFNGCTGPAGLKFAVTGVGSWFINITDSTSGVSTGTVSNIVANVVSTSGPTCSFGVGSNTGSFTGTIAPGTVKANYTNSTQNLAVPASTPGSLGLWNVKSGSNTYCISPSILKQGDAASFQATYKLVADTAAYNPVAIN